MFTGKIKTDIQVIIYKDNEVYETYTFNPNTIEPFKNEDEAKKFLEEKLSILNKNATKNNKEQSIELFLVDENNQQINSGIVGQTVRLVIETNLPLKDELIVPVSDQFSNNYFLITLRKTEPNRWESKSFELKQSGLFNIIDDKFLILNGIPTETLVVGYDVIVADI